MNTAIRHMLALALASLLAPSLGVAAVGGQSDSTGFQALQQCHHDGIIPLAAACEEALRMLDTDELALIWAVNHVSQVQMDGLVDAAKRREDPSLLAFLLRRAAARFPRVARYHEALAAALARGGIGLNEKSEPSPVEYYGPLLFAAQLRPDSSRLRAELAWHQLELGLIDSSLSNFAAAVRKDSASGSARLGLATALCRRGRYDDAIRELRFALPSASSAPVGDIGCAVRSLMAMALAWVGRATEAEAILRQAGSKCDNALPCTLANVVSWRGHHAQAAQACADSIDGARPPCACVGRAEPDGGEVIGPEEMEVMSTLLQAGTLASRLSTRRLVVESQTADPGSVGSALIRQALRGGARRAAMVRDNSWGEAVDDLFARSSTPVLLPPSGRSAAGASVVLTRSDLMKAGLRRSRSIAARFPGVSGVAIVTRPGFASDYRRAVVGVHFYGPGRADDLVFFMLQKQNGVWLLLPDEIRP